MASFSIQRGMSGNLPEALSDGQILFTYDDGKLYVDCLDSTGSVSRCVINAKNADTLGGAILSTTVEDSDEQIPTSSACLDTFMRDELRGIANGVAPLNENKKISTDYLPSYVDANYVPNEDIADLNGKNTWTSEQTYNYDDYNLVTTDVLNGVACGFKSARGLFNQLFVGDVVFPRKSKDQNSGMADEIGFYIWSGVDSKIATKDDDGNITTEGHNTLKDYTKVASVTKDGGLILKSSTQSSSKYFKLTIDDNGQISIAEVQTSI